MVTLIYYHLMKIIPQFSFLKFYVMGPTEINSYGIAHVNVHFILLQNMYVIPRVGRFVRTTSFAQCVLLSNIFQLPTFENMENITTVAYLWLWAGCYAQGVPILTPMLTCKFRIVVCGVIPSGWDLLKIRVGKTRQFHLIYSGENSVLLCFHSLM